jgi:hypothetical protein
MPFTPSHAVVAIPLRRFGLIPSAVAIGSMAPDFEFFIRLAFDQRFGHSVRGMLTFSIPAALVVFSFYHFWLRMRLVSLLPVSVQQRLGTAIHIPSGPRFMGRAALSTVVGVLSHVLWDGFTHTHEFGVEAMPFLATPVAPTPWGHFCICNALQMISSGAGLIIVAWWVFRWYRTATPRPIRVDPGISTASQIRIGSVTLAAVILITCLHVFQPLPCREVILGIRLLTSRAIAAGITFGCLGIALAASTPRRVRVQIPIPISDATAAQTDI